MIFISRFLMPFWLIYRQFSKYWKWLKNVRVLKVNFPTWFKVAYCWLFILFWRKVIFFLYFMLTLWNSLFSNPFCDYLASYSRRASTCSGNMFGPAVPAPHKKRSIPNMDKRGSTASGSGLYGLVIPPKVTKVSHLHHYFNLHVC